MVLALQTMVTRRFDVFDPVVVTVGLFQAGTRRNIIPDEARFEATVRALSAPAMERLREHTQQLCRQLAAAHGLTAEVAFSDEYPVTANHPAHADRALATAAELFGADRSRLVPEPLMGSEDFSRVLAAVPGAFVFLGAGPGEDYRAAPSNHSPRARFDDGLLPDAALLLAELAARALADPV
jgi:hippurate hydrolase